MEHRAQRNDLERKLQESRRRIDAKGLVLDMRSQQLLNYTHEHVDRSRVESERRLEEQIKNGILASHNRIQEAVREQTQNLALQIQEQLCGDRQREAGEMETLLTRQSVQWQHAVELVEERGRTDVREVAAAHARGWNEYLDGIKTWTQQYVDTSIQENDEAVIESFSRKMKGYVDQRLIAYENHVEDLISVSIREERAARDKASDAYSTKTREDLKRHLDNKIKRLTESHENEYASLK
ncbi:hypothetical protein PI125_g18349 [Phytophthora idaei]|nr:hypothetical protein PI125_g18349 [Phytophthora idaei]